MGRKEEKWYECVGLATFDMVVATHSLRQFLPHFFAKSQGVIP